MLSLEYAQSMGSLVESILERILKEIEAQPDISEIESQRLNTLCKSLHGLSKLFGDDPQETSFAKYVPSWFKFCFLSELLEASMADIMWMHQEGLLLEYSSNEIIGLIRALFSDSNLRAKNIDIIAAAKMEK
ncbi:uncharacterized protein MELLADRAFT_70705 [Melampsora larici-populina 98AG31]|uniref:ZW10 C-terminal helical domain-containing protein n=1 Tax=Melampsora larici-populina (strain 98AG31 / pathotype 3-4-7) TaxID=747676 RepID=F4R5S2_MELLP|nr:uncharacterized protein MELLADRAFT_70705 [Melampsora larici-populina 98AG31]EGG12207.1 hypothetical protein MELLADRAFT_70705 [Melampsora larici-populina 98AG31]